MDNKTAIFILNGLKIYVSKEVEDAINTAVRSMSYDLSPEKIRDILVEHGQHDLQFHVGETIRYSPREVQTILEEET